MTRWLAIPALVAIVACGRDGSLPAYDGDLAAPSPREARVTVTPALDFSDASSRVGQHFVVDELVVNLSDVRILGEDPSIPPGGYPLMRDPRLVVADGTGEVGIELPFPPSFLEQEGLAIYLRSEPSEALGEASILVSGRWVDDDAASSAALTTGVVDPDGEPVHPEGSGRGDGVVDPDGEPVHPEDRDERDGVVDPDGEPVKPKSGVVDPDGEPVRPGKSRQGVVDPDGEPVDCGEVDCRRAPRALTDGTPVVLREAGVVELVVSLGHRSRFNLVFGIPATRWIDEDTSDRIIDESETERPESMNGGVEPIVLTAMREALFAGGSAELDAPEDLERSGAPERSRGYYLADGVPLEDALSGRPGL